MELTILMPCLNEEKTLHSCIKEAKEYLEKQHFTWEILVVDNGSMDDSVRIAKENGARVIICKEKGYGNAIRAGLKAARGRYVIYGDCDMSYDFKESGKIYELLLDGAEFVAGDRFHPIPDKKAMCLSHRIGVPVLSWIGRVRYKVNVHDFHCGFIGIKKSCAEQLNLNSSGMEFSTEIIGKAAMAKLLIKQVPVTLRPDGRDSPPHLRTWHDGMRHLLYMLKSNK